MALQDMFKLKKEGGNYLQKYENIDLTGKSKCIVKFTMI